MALPPAERTSAVSNRAEDFFMMAIPGKITSRESEAGSSDSRKEKLAVNQFFSGRSCDRFHIFSGRSNHVFQFSFLEPARGPSRFLNSIFTQLIAGFPCERHFKINYLH